MSANNQAAGAMNARGMTPPENDLRGAVTRGEADEITARLAEVAQALVDQGLYPAAGTVRRASRNIVALRADLERVTAERDEDVEMLAMTATAHSISETEAEEEAETLLSGIQAVAAARDTAEAENTRLRDRLAEARATNRRLHRRLQAVEGPTAARAAKAERAAAFWFKRRKAAGGRNSALRAENTRLSALLVDAGEALRPFAKLSFSFDGFSFEPAEIVVLGHCCGKFHSKEHEHLQRAIDAAQVVLAALDKAPTPKEPA